MMVNNNNLERHALKIPVNKIKMIIECDGFNISNLDKNSIYSSSKINTILEVKFSNNKIRHMPVGFLISIKRLELIDFSFNNFIIIDKNYFKNSKYLTKIIFSHNSINNISSESFNYNHNLIYINMEYNLIRLLPADIFKYNNKLQYIIFNNNNIITIDGSWKHLIALHNITLNNNKLQYFSEDIFKWNRKVIMGISNNSFHCGCDIKWVLYHSMFYVEYSLVPVYCKFHTSYKLSIFDFITSHTSNKAIELLKFMECSTGYKSIRIIK